MKRLVVCLAVFSFGLTLTAQTASLPRYKVLPASSKKAAPAQWNAAADQGYHLIFEARLAVMRLDTAPPDTYRYQPLPDRNLRATFLNALNEQGAFGYRWIPTTRMLEKLPHPRTYEYAVVDGFAGKTRARSLDELVAQGFTPVGRFGNVPVYMRETGADPAPPSITPPERHLDRTRPHKLMEQIIASGHEGFRYKANTITEKGDVLTMEDCGPACGAPFEYRAFDFKSAPQLENELNTLGAQGFRLVLDSLGFPPHVVERSSQVLQYTYRVAEAKDPAALEQFLNIADRDGFVPVGFAAHVGWTANLMMVVEKATPPAGQAQ